jgi:signal transduction histidine kinase
MLRILITLFFVLPLFTVSAQDNLKFTSYGVDDGLAQSTIYDICQDKDGFIWVGTADGLCRFDGYQFKVYKTIANNPRSIASYKEFRFYTDKEGRFWIISFNGLSLYNPATDDFTNVIVYKPSNLVVAENHFFGEDEEDLWVGLCNYGIVKVNKKTLRAVKTPLTKTTLRNSINTAYHGFLEKDKLWVIDYNESAQPVLFRYDINKQKKDILPIPVSNIINLNDSTFFGVNANTTFIINKKTLSYRTALINANGSDAHIISIKKHADDEVFICSSTQGLIYFSTKSNRVTHSIGSRNSDANSPIFASCVFTDRSGNTWIGTRGDGVEKISYPFKKFKWYRPGNTKNNNVFGLYANNETLFASAQGQGLFAYSRSGSYVKTIELNKQLDAISNIARCIRPLGKDKLLLLSNARNKTNDIPYIYNIVTQKIKLLNKEVQTFYKAHWGKGNLRYFLLNDNEKTYLTNIGEYLVSLNVCGEDIFCPVVIKRFPGETLTCCFRERNGNLWVGNFNGAYCLSNKGWEKVAIPKNKEIKTITQDPDGNIWLGTNDEIFVMNQNHQVIQRYSEESGLVNAHVYALRCDKLGNIWFSHNKGLSVYLWKQKKFEHFSKDDGLQSSEFNVGASDQSEDGEVFFGGISGVTSFKPEEILRNPNAPQVKITGIKLFDEPLVTDTAYWKIQQLKLNYTDNSISFEFVLPEYTNQLKNKYAYIMEGVDDKWINAGDKRFARYAGLQPGHYTFRVKGFNNDGIESAATAVRIIIVPPFWQRTWFIVLCGFAFILLSIGTGIWIQKIRQQKAMQAFELQHKIQMERERISRDLHDNVGTQLSLISKNIQGVIDPVQNISDTERIRNLSAISQTSKEVIFTLRETIWALNKEEIPLEELSDKLKSFTRKLFETNKNCELFYTEEISGNEPVLGPSEAIHLFRICQEAIANSLKYAEASTMNISISAVKGKYNISIADNGIGFDPQIQKTEAHYGLDNMRFRAEEIDCTCTIEAVHGKGTRIVIQKR